MSKQVVDRSRFESKTTSLRETSLSGGFVVELIFSRSHARHYVEKNFAARAAEMRENRHGRETPKDTMNTVKVGERKSFGDNPFSASERSTHHHFIPTDPPSRQNRPTYSSKIASSGLTQPEARSQIKEHRSGSPRPQKADVARPAVALIPPLLKKHYNSCEYAPPFRLDGAWMRSSGGFGVDWNGWEGLKGWIGAREFG